MLTSDGFCEFSEHAFLELLNDIRANPLIGFPSGTDIFGIPTDLHHVLRREFIRQLDIELRRLVVHAAAWAETMKETTQSASITYNKKLRQ